MVFNATFNLITVISWQSVLLVEETGVPGENHRSTCPKSLKEIRLRNRLRKKNVLKFGRESDTLKYKKQRNKVNNMKKKAKENFESNLDNILLDNSTNPKTYWKIMKMVIKSNKGSNCIPPLRNTINDEHLDEMVYDDDNKCELLNKYFSLVSKLEEVGGRKYTSTPSLEVKLMTQLPTFL
jgi:hypothetical protein